MFDVGWTELLLIGVVSLIVIGPKDLPAMFHALGRITARARGMAREFSSAMEEAAKASGMEDATRELRDLQKLTSPRALGLDALSRAADRFEKWDPLEPMRESTASAPVPDPAAPPPVSAPSDATASIPVGGTISAPPAGAGNAAAADAAATRAADVAQGTRAATAHRPGARQLHAVRRSDRS